MGTFTGFCSRNMGFAPGRCVEETEHAHPVTLKRQGRVCTLILNGELYNAKELGRELKADTDRNEELFLLAYMQYGPEFVKKINGVFGAVIWDSETGSGQNQCFIRRKRRRCFLPLPLEAYFSIRVWTLCWMRMVSVKFLRLVRQELPETVFFEIFMKCFRDIIFLLQTEF